ncbi:MAG TPA: molecular chaperone DnaJ, partial [Flavobacterium sp.]|nr:molecular chaperone DnaJ [Flavobacterium sp.]
MEIKILESQINAFDNEKTELEKVLSDFQHRHTLELGEIILEILKLRKIKFKNQHREKESEEDFNNYQE